MFNLSPIYSARKSAYTLVSWTIPSIYQYQVLKKYILKKNEQEQQFVWNSI